MGHAKINLLRSDNPIDTAGRMKYNAGGGAATGRVTIKSEPSVDPKCLNCNLDWVHEQMHWDHLFGKEKLMDKPTKDMLTKAMTFLEDAKNIISSAADDARNAYEEMSDEAQETIEGEGLNELANSLQEMDDSLDNVIGELGELINDK